MHSVFPECVNGTLPNNYIREIKEFYNNNNLTNLCYLKIDIKSFYDNIDHDILLNILKKRIKSNYIIELLRKAIKTPTVPINYKKIDKSKYKRTYGIAQGLSISNILANIYLSDFDKKFNVLGLKYLRYVDDILFIIEDNKLQDLEHEINEELKSYKLELNDTKRECQFGTCNLEYLSYKLLLPKVSIKDANVERFITSIAAKFAFYNHSSKSQRIKYTWLTKDIQKKVFIEDLNEKITGAISENKRYGWLFYFLEINDMKLLHKLDSIIGKFFSKLDDFNNCPPKPLKKLSKAYYKAKNQPFGGYIHNYEIYNSIKDKITYLSNRGYLNPKGHYKSDDIEIIFNRIKRRRLADLELDVGSIS